MAAKSAASDHRPPDDAASEVVTVEQAYLTSFARGPLRTDGGPVRWVRGAVHDAEGALVPQSQRTWNRDRMDPIPADPKQVRVRRRATRLRGTWMYAGNWSTHFGHFVLETLPNLWPDPDDHAGTLIGVIAHRPVRGRLPPDADRVRLQSPELVAWQRDLLDLVGYGKVDLRVVHGRDVRVERLVVPSRPVVLKRSARPAAVRVWRRVSDAVGDRGDDPLIYLSRSSFHGGNEGAGRARTDQARDARLDATFAESGFRIVHPETLPISRQIELVRGARVLAGLSGSALHLSAFADPGTRILIVGDRRSRGKPFPAQVMVDTACGHHSMFVPNEDDVGLARTLAALSE